jgi:hypothetical protein
MRSSVLIIVPRSLSVSLSLSAPYLQIAPKRKFKKPGKYFRQYSLPIYLYAQL